MTRFSSYDGTSLAYRRLGAGPLLVCIPGGPGRASEYLEDLGGLSEHRTLVLLDNRGTGASAMPADRSTLRLDRLADDVEALRLHLGEEALHVLGHSAGAVVAQVWAARHPTRVASLTLVTPSDKLQGGARADLDAIRAARAGEPWYADAAAAMTALADAPSEQALWRRVRPFFYGRWDDRTRAHAFSVETQTNADAERGWGAGAAAVDTSAILAGLRQVHADTRVIGGEHDAITGVASVDVVARSFPNATTRVLAGAGHFPWVDEPAAFVSAVLRRD